MDMDGVGNVMEVVASLCDVYSEGAVEVSNIIWIHIRLSTNLDVKQTNRWTVKKSITQTIWMSYLE